MPQNVNGVTTYFVGNHYELTGSQVTKYYFAGATRIAMRKYTIPQAMNLEYLLADHLGSTSLTTDTNGAKVSEMRYCAASHRDKPWGELRYTWTSNPATAPVYALMRYTFCEAPLAGTGQYSYLDAPTTSASEGFGLMFYNARWYDPYLNRFIQADTVVQNSIQGLDRYAYASNNPVMFTDPTGHLTEQEICKTLGYCDEKEARTGLGENMFKLLWNTKITWGDTVLISDSNVNPIETTLVLLYNNENQTYSAALWNISTGERVSWAVANRAERVAAYNATNDAWYSSDQQGAEWCTRDECENWAGGKPTTHDANDLFVDENYIGYELVNYKVYDGQAYFLFALGVFTLPFPIFAGNKLNVVKNITSLMLSLASVGDLAPKYHYPIAYYHNAQTDYMWYHPSGGFSNTP